MPLERGLLQRPSLETHNDKERWLGMRYSHLTVAAVSIALGAGVAAQQRAERANMDLVGYDDLQNRSAYHSVIQKQGDRWITYIGHHGGVALNPLTGMKEPNGT